MYLVSIRDLTARKAALAALGLGLVVVLCIHLTLLALAPVPEAAVRSFPSTQQLVWVNKLHLDAHAITNRAEFNAARKHLPMEAVLYFRDRSPYHGLIQYVWRDHEKIVPIRLFDVTFAEMDDNPNVQQYDSVYSDVDVRSGTFRVHYEKTWDYWLGGLTIYLVIVAGFGFIMLVDTLFEEE